MINIDLIDIERSSMSLKITADSDEDKAVLKSCTDPLKIKLAGSIEDGLIVNPSFVDMLGRALVPARSRLNLTETFKEWRAVNKASIKIECGVINSRIKGIGVPDEEIDKRMKYFFKPAVNSQKYKRGIWDGYIRLFNKRTGGFPTGLLYLVEEILKDKKLNYSVDKRYEEKPDKMFDWVANDKITPEEDQVEAVKNATKYLRGVIKAPTGFGKTAVLATRIIAEFGVPSLFIANKKSLLDDARESFIDLIDGLDESEVGQIKDGVFDKVKAKNFSINDRIESKVLVATIQSLEARLKDPNTSKAIKLWLSNNCKLIMVDECQATGTETWEKVLNSCSAPLRFMLSATPYRTDGASLKIHAQSGDAIYYTSAEEQILKGRLCELDIKYITYDHHLFNQRDSDILYPEAYESWIVNNEDRNQLIVDKSKEMLDEERMALVLINRIEHGDVLKELLTKEFPDKTIEFIFGGSKDKERIKAIADARIGDIDILIGSTIFDAGVNIPAISGVIIAGAGNSEITLIQKIGRGARKVDYEKATGKIPKFMIGQDQKITKVYDILDENVKFFEAQAWNRYKIAKEEYGSKRVKFEGEIHKYSKNKSGGKTSYPNNSAESQEKMLDILNKDSKLRKAKVDKTSIGEKEMIEMFKL